MCVHPRWLQVANAAAEAAAVSALAAAAAAEESGAAAQAQATAAAVAANAEKDELAARLAMMTAVAEAAIGMAQASQVRHLSNCKSLVHAQHVPRFAPWPPAHTPYHGARRVRV